MWPLFPTPLGVLGFSSLSSSPALILEVFIGLAADGWIKAGGEGNHPHPRLSQLRCRAGRAAAKSRPSARLFAQCARAAGCRLLPAAPPTTWGRRPRAARWPDKCSGAGRRSALTWSAWAFRRLVALRSAPEPALHFPVPWRTGGSHTTVSTGSGWGSGAIWSSSGRRWPRPQPWDGRPRGARVLGERWWREPGGEAAVGVGWTRKWAAELLIPQSWRCEELRLEAAGSEVG